jgi:hypothetical protein
MDLNYSESSVCSDLIEVGQCSQGVAHHNGSDNCCKWHCRDLSHAMNRIVDILRATTTQPYRYMGEGIDLRVVFEGFHCDWSTVQAVLEFLTDGGLHGIVAICFELSLVRSPKMVVSVKASCWMCYSKIG